MSTSHPAATVQQQVRLPKWPGEAVAACTDRAASHRSQLGAELGTAAVVVGGSVEEQQVVQLQGVLPDMAAAVVAAPQLQVVGHQGRDATREQLKSPEQVQVIALVL